jgi:hypothetical protein
LYRKENTDVYFRLIVTGINANTYNDSATQVLTTYEYYVRPVFTSGIEGIKSNIVSATTPGLQYIYSLRSSGLDIYDVLNTAAPFFNSTESTLNGQFNPESEIADPDYLWINNGLNVQVLQHSANPLNLTQVSSFVNGGWGIIVRRGQADRNNLLFTYNAAWDIASYDISDPANPVLINTQANPGFSPSLRGLAYDSIGHRLYANWNNGGGSATNVYWFPVAADGSLGAAVFLTNMDSNGGAAPCAFIYNGSYFAQWRLAAYRAFDLTTAIETAGFWIGYPPHYGFWTGTTPRLKNGFLFLGSSNGDANHQTVIIYQIDPLVYVPATGDPVVQWQLGPTSVNCVGLMISGNLLIFATSGNVLYVYDLTPLFATGAIPVLLGSCPITVAQINGLSGYFSDGWEGNNGGCAT